MAKNDQGGLRWLTALASGATALVGLLVLAKAVLEMHADHTTDALAYLAAGVVALLAATIERFESFKGLGVEAKIKLDSTIERAEVTLVQMRGVVEALGTEVVRLTSATGRYDSAPTMQEAYETSRSIATALRAVGSGEDVVHRALRPWARVSAFDVLDTLRISTSDTLKKFAVDTKNQRTEEHKSSGESQNFHALNTLMARSSELAERIKSEGWSVDDVWGASGRLRSVIAECKALDPRAGGLVEVHLGPWITRFEHLASRFDFDDREAWFAIRPM